MTLYEYMHTVDVTDASGRTPLHYAAITGNEETLTTLLLCNPDINRVSKDGTSPLHEAIIHDHPRTYGPVVPPPRTRVSPILPLGIFTLLVQHYADAEQLFQDYLPALILAVYLGHRQIVELFLRLGVDVNLVEMHAARSALHYAAYFHRDTSIFQLLLSSTVRHAADINARDANGFSVLDYARGNVHGSSAFADLLLQLNVFDPNRGENATDELHIDKPDVKVFPSASELSLLTKKAKQKQSRGTAH